MCPRCEIAHIPTGPNNRLIIRGERGPNGELPVIADGLRLNNSHTNIEFLDIVGGIGGAEAGHGRRERDIVIQGCAIHDMQGNGRDGIGIYNITEAKIINNILYNGSIGIRVADYAEDVLIANNTMFNMGTGLYLAALQAVRRGATQSGRGGQIEMRRS